MSKTLTKEEQTLNQHVEDLRERMRMLQNDRRANIEVLEANKAANKEEIKDLRDTSKELRQKLAQLQRTALLDDDKDEQKHVEREIDRLRKLCDELRLKSSRYRKQLEDLRDEVRDLELDSVRPHMEDNDYTRRIRALENKLDKAMIKYNEAQSIRKTYEQIVRRLKEERVGFDNQLAAIERTLSAKQRDYEELLLLAGDANHARETALGELDRVRAGYEEERRRRERELRERHQVVQLRRQMLERIKQRETMRNQLAETAAQSTTSLSMTSAAAQKNLAVEKVEQRNKIDVFENAFRKIKEATGNLLTHLLIFSLYLPCLTSSGVSDVNEVIQKIVSQESTTENLISLTRENQVKIEALNELRRKLKLKVEEIKYSTVGGGHRRKMIDDHEDQLANSAARLDRSSLKYERLNKVIIAIKAGVGHLQEKLESMREELGGRRLELSDETVVDVLRESELCLNNLQRRIRAAEDDRKRMRLNGVSGLDQGSTTSLASSNVADELNVSAVRPFNQRIDLQFDDADPALDLGDDIGAIDLDDDELTRDKVKRASSQILLAIDRKKRKPKKSSNEEKSEPAKNTTPFAATH